VAPTVFVRDECHHLAVGRHRRRVFDADEIGEALKLNVARERWRAPGANAPPRRHHHAREHCAHRHPQRDAAPRQAGSTGRFGRRGGVRRIEHDRRVADVAQTSSRILFETSSEQVLDFERGLGWKGGPIRLAIEDGDDRIGRGLARKRAATGQHLVQHRPKRPDIGPLVDRPTPRLLRRHVRRRPEQDAIHGRSDHRRRMRQVGGRGGVRPFGSGPSCRSRRP
jgi:hypothetical protein